MWHLQYDSSVDEEIDGIPQNAFFVIEGVKVYPLVKRLISIGRRVENDLVIDDPRVSRRHAELRANQEQEQFVLIDLNSTGGTFVNGRRISQSILYPGDVVSIGGLLLTFNQDEPPPRPDLIDTVR